MARLRLRRAESLVRQFQRAQWRFHQHKPYSIRLQRKDDAPSEIEVYLSVHRDPPPELGFLAGDAMHNLRAILDNLVWGLGVQHGYSPDNTNLAFPVAKSPQAWFNTIAHLTNLPEGAKDVLQRHQPYKNPPRADRICALSVINDLWNSDKHRTPHVVNGFLREGRILIGDKAFPTDLAPRTLSASQGEVKLITFFIVRGWIRADQKQNYQIDADIVFDEGVPTVPGLSVGDTLDQSNAFVKRVIGELEPFFEG